MCILSVILFISSIYKSIIFPLVSRDFLQFPRMAMVMTPEFHTLGSYLPLGPRTTQPPEVVNEPRSYKALVMVFLAGGQNLSWLMLQWKLCLLPQMETSFRTDTWRVLVYYVYCIVLHVQ